HDGEVDLIVNTPYGTGGRLDGYEIRTAAVSRSVPCLTTVQALAAAVQGIDALNHGGVGVRSLQEHAEQLTEMTLGDQLDPDDGIEVSRATETARRASAVPIM
ncbi:hypothetical protein ACIRP4_13550, partial [Streptomyces bacillaris]|uniref:hypothetical protein n=1 Tax=Streptomyces bacillaris TaxID=68179 RepID=UPI00380EEEE0